MFICTTNELPTCELEISQCTLLKTLQAIRSALLFMKSVWHICPGASSIYQTQPIMMYLVETWSSNHERIWVGVCSFTHTWSVLLRTFSLLIDCIFYQLVCRLLGFSHGVRRGYAVPIFSNEGEGRVCNFPVAWINSLGTSRVHVYRQNEWAPDLWTKNPKAHSSKNSSSHQISIVVYEICLTYVHWCVIDLLNSASHEVLGWDVVEQSRKNMSWRM